jgi:cytochrome P450
MKTQSTLSHAALRRIVEAFTMETIKALSPQQRSSVNVMIQKVAAKDGEDVLTIPRLEGVKGMLLQHFWRS